MKDKKMNFPRMVVSNWFDLRKKAQENPYMSFTPKSISKALKITIGSVYANIFPALRHFDLVDNIGKPTPLGRDWLDDEKYDDVCSQLIETKYPSELNNIPDPLNNREKVTEWFLKKTGAKINIVQQLTSTYLMLRKADTNDVPMKNTEHPISTESIKSKQQMVLEAIGYNELTGKKPKKIRELKPKKILKIKHEKILKLKHEKLPKVKHEKLPKVKHEKLLKIKHEKLSEIKQEKLPELKQTSVAPAKMNSDNSNSKNSGKNTQININVKLSVSSEISLEQIDSLFAGMGKYLAGN